MIAQEDLLTQLYEKYSRPVRVYCLRRLDDEVSDAVAEVFMVAWRRIDDVPAGDMTLPWLYGVARKVVSNHRRSRDRRSNLSIKLSGVRPQMPSQPESQIVQHAEYDQVHAALQALREKDREVLLLAAWEELSNAQIAAALGCSTQTAAQRLHRAKRKLGRTFRAISGLPASDERERR